jgi:hypothetical protein
MGEIHMENKLKNSRKNKLVGKIESQNINILSQKILFFFQLLHVMITFSIDMSLTINPTYFFSVKATIFLKSDIIIL